VPNENSVPKSRIHPQRGCGSKAEAISRPMALSFRFQLPQRGRKSSSIRAIAARRQMTERTIYLSGTQLLFELHVNTATSGIDSNAVLGGRNADYHTGLI